MQEKPKQDMLHPFVGQALITEVRRASFSNHIGKFETGPTKIIEEESVVLGTVGTYRKVMITKSPQGYFGFIPFAGQLLRLASSGTWENRLGQCVINLKDVFNLGDWKSVVICSNEGFIRYYRFCLKTCLFTDINGKIGYELASNQYSMVRSDDLILTRGMFPDAAKWDKFPNEKGGGVMVLGSYLAKMRVDIDELKINGMPDFYKILALLNFLEIIKFEVPNFENQNSTWKFLNGGTAKLNWPIPMVESTVVRALIANSSELQDVAGRFFLDPDMCWAVSKTCKNLGLIPTFSHTITYESNGSFTLGSNRYDFEPLVSAVIHNHMMHEKVYVTSERTRQAIYEKLTKERLFFFPALCHYQ
jgi:hypothetical protein